MVGWLGRKKPSDELVSNFWKKFMIESKSTFFPKFHELSPPSFGMMFSAFLNSFSGLNKSG